MMTAAAMMAIATAMVVVAAIASVMAGIATAMAAVAVIATAMAAMATAMMSVAAMATAMRAATVNNNQPKEGGNGGADEDPVDGCRGVFPPQICGGNR